MKFFAYIWFCLALWVNAAGVLINITHGFLWVAALNVVGALVSGTYVVRALLMGVE